MRVAFVLRSVEVQPLFRDLCRRQLIQSKGYNLLCCFAISLPSPTVTCHLVYNMYKHYFATAKRQLAEIYIYININIPIVYIPTQTDCNNSIHTPSKRMVSAYLSARVVAPTTPLSFLRLLSQPNTLYFAARLASAVAYSLSRGTAAPWFNSKARFLLFHSICGPFSLSAFCLSLCPSNALYLLLSCCIWS
jgi:hypothetical protein